MIIILGIILHIICLATAASGNPYSKDNYLPDKLCFKIALFPLKSVS